MATPLTSICLRKRLFAYSVRRVPETVLTQPADLDASFAALGDPVRRALVTRLARGEATVGQLAEPFALTPQAISHHLGVLRRAGLVEQRREGTSRPCRLRPEALAGLGNWIDEQRRMWDDRLVALEKHLDGNGDAR